MMWYGSNGPSWWGWMLMSVSMIAFWGVVIWGIWFLVTRATRSEPGASGLGAERILDERLARGEIDTDEYTRLREVIRTKGTPTGNGRAPASTGVPR